MERMVKLGGAVLEALVEEWGTAEALRRLADPCWFQALGCFLGYDWHSSGLTTTVTAALKEALRQRPGLGLWGAGGKGKTSLKTPAEIREAAEREGLDPAPLERASRLAAKVDSAALQDGFQLYHHAFFFDREGRWAVVQQGMNPRTRWARRYHWLSESLSSFVNEPHAAVASEVRLRKALNMVAADSAGSRRASVELACENPDKITLEYLKMPRQHRVVVRPENLRKVLVALHERSPRDYEELLLTPGVGPASVRALALLGELLYGEKPSWRDPAVYSFAHGGKDGTPYPVNLRVYEETISVLERALRMAKAGRREGLEAIKRARLALGL